MSHRSAVPASRRVMMAAVALFGIAAGAGCGSSDAKPSDTSTPVSPPTSSAPATSGATGGLTLRTPDQIGSLKKAASQSEVEFVLKSITGTAGVEQPIGIVYENSTGAGQTVVVWGGLGPTAATDAEIPQQLGQMVRSGIAADATLSDPTTVDSGSLGGLARCASLVGPADEMLTNCAWASGRAGIVVSFKGFEPDKAMALMPTILSAVVTA